MSGFSIRAPYFIVVVCLIIVVVGVATLQRMPVDLFPEIKLTQIVVATFYSGMPPEQIETDITSKYERFFTLGSGIDHMESRSLPGVSLIKIYFQPGTSPDAAAAMISNLAMANLRRLPPGTLPPVVLKFDASSLPVCLVVLKGENMSETELRDIGQFTVRNQIASVPGSTIPQPFGGKFRQIMIYVDPEKLEAHQLSPMDVVRAVNDSNLILPAGDVRIGPLDYNIYTNSQIASVTDIDSVPLKTVGQAPVTVGEIGHTEDGHAIQYNVVRVDGQPSVYLPILRQGGDSNTIAVVEGIVEALKHLTDVPKQLLTTVVFDQSVFVKRAVETLLEEGGISLVLTGVMILLFLGSFRATSAVFLSIPLSVLTAIILLALGGGTINTMILSGFALAFSRLIDNSVIVLENIFRHMELGTPRLEASERGGTEVTLPVLAATLTTAIVFFPVTFLFGVSKFLFSALALAVVLSLFASYLVAMTVVPLFCSKFLQAPNHDKHKHGLFDRMLDVYEHIVRVLLRRPGWVVVALMGLFVLSLGLYPVLGLAFVPRTDAGQFSINVKAPSGTNLQETEKYVAQVEDVVRKEVAKDDLSIIVSNIGVSSDFSAIYTTNSAPHTGFVLVALKEGHHTSSFDYITRVRERLRQELPVLTTFFQSGGMAEAVLNQGLPAPLDLQVTGSHLDRDYQVAAELAGKIRALPGVSDVYIPQDINNPALELNIDRLRASRLGLSQREVVTNVITALTSNGMIAPSYWIDPRSGNDYLLTVQYPEQSVRSLPDLQTIPLRASGAGRTTSLDSVTSMTRIESPTEVDHYQIQKLIDVYVSPVGEDLGHMASGVQRILDSTALPDGVRVNLRGMVQGMNSTFRSFAIGLALSLVLLYLVLVAQFKSFIDPVMILLAVPMGLVGVMVTLPATGTTLNVQSLMGVIMMSGIVVSNSILIVEFAHRQREEGMSPREAVITSCRIRLRPILMTSLATIIGLLPMALKLGTGSEAYAPLARVIIGGLTVSLVLTVVIVPAAYLLIHEKREVAQ